jgi:hypothetical protein
MKHQSAQLYQPDFLLASSRMEALRFNRKILQQDFPAGTLQNFLTATQQAIAKCNAQLPELENLEQLYLQAHILYLSLWESYLSQAIENINQTPGV